MGTRGYERKGLPLALSEGEKRAKYFHVQKEQGRESERDKQV